MQDLGGPPKEIMGDLPEGFVRPTEYLTGVPLTMSRISVRWAAETNARSCSDARNVYAG